MKAVIGLMKITTGDTMNQVFDFLSALSGAVIAAATGSGYEALINVGIDALSFAYKEGKKKNDENWLIKVLVVDREPTNTADLKYVLQQIYKEDENLNVIENSFIGINWHIVHAGLNIIFKTL